MTLEIYLATTLQTNSTLKGLRIQFCTLDDELNYAPNKEMNQEVATWNNCKFM